MSKRNPTPELLSFSDADERLDESLSTSFQGGYDRVLLFDGDLAVTGDLQKAVKKLAKGAFDLIAISGDLKVDGRLALYESTPGLYVGGSTTAETLEGGDCEIYIQDGTFTYFVYGYYNDGILETGPVKTPWLINSDHDLRVEAGKKTKRIDNYGDDDDYDFGSENIATSFVDAVRGKKDPNAINIDAFYKHLKAGNAVLVAKAKTGTEKALADVKGAKVGKKTELVVKATKLKKFPAEALKMPWLTKLVLDGNQIGDVPEAIGKLTQLEELSLNNCNLAKLPEAIGKLTKLRVLRIAGNTRYSGPGDRCVPIKLPTSFGQLVNLEELDVSALSAEVPGQDNRRLPDITTFELPASAATLTKLRVLRANYTNLVLPKAMWGLPSLEELEMSGRSWCYLKEFPPFVTSFTNLVRLDLSSNFFTSIPELGRLQKLEELNLGNALGLIKKLPDLSKLTKLRVLNVSGNTDRTNVPEPAHEVLAPLFKMKLPALEDLRIDRWGKEDHRGHLPPTLLAGVGTFKALRKLDLEFDGLNGLPADFFQLVQLEELKLGYNRLGAPVLARIKKAFPKAKIDVGIQK